MAVNVAAPTPVRIEDGDVRLPGELGVPADAPGLVVFAHGSGSSHTSPRNRAVAETLQAAGLATLLFDLLEPHEAVVRENVFDVALLADRLELATRWARARDDVGGLPLGYFGASTGAAAALAAAAQLGELVGAVVSRGGRPDLAGEQLEWVNAPTLLVVGGADTDVLRMNEEALRRLRAEAVLEVVPGAGHLFEEPGAIEQVSDLATAWFVRHLGGR